MYQGLSPANVQSFASDLRIASSQLEEQAAQARRALGIADLESPVVARLFERSDLLQSVAAQLHGRASQAERDGLDVPGEVGDLAYRSLVAGGISGIDTSVLTNSGLTKAVGRAEKPGDTIVRDTIDDDKALVDTDDLPGIDEAEESQKRVDEAHAFIQPMVHLEPNLWERYWDIRQKVKEHEAAELRQVAARLSDEELKAVLGQLSQAERDVFWFGMTGGLVTLPKVVVDTKVISGEITLKESEANRLIEDATDLIRETIEEDIEDAKTRFAWYEVDAATQLRVWRLLNALTPEQQDAVIAQFGAEDQLTYLLDNVPHRQVD